MAVSTINDKIQNGVAPRPRSLAIHITHLSEISHLRSYNPTAGSQIRDASSSPFPVPITKYASFLPFHSCLTHFKQRAQQRHSLANSPENARLPGRVDTTSTSSHDIHHYDHPSISVSLRLSTCLFFFTIHAAWRSKSTIITIPFCCIVEIIPLHP